MPEPINAPYDSPIDPHGSDPADLTNDEVDDICRRIRNTDIWLTLALTAVAICAITLSIVVVGIADRVAALEHPAPPPSGDARSVNAP